MSNYNAYKAIADKTGLSDVTVRAAFARKPITYRTACKIAKHMKIEIAAFRIKYDQRGLNKGQKQDAPAPRTRSRDST